MTKWVKFSGTMAGVIIGLSIFCQSGVLAETVLQPTIEMKGYKVEFDEYGAMTIFYKEQPILASLGRIGFRSPDKYHDSPPTTVSVVEAGEKKECSWSASLEKLGFRYECKAIFSPNKIKWILVYSFQKECRGQVRNFVHLFPGNVENLLGSVYKMTNTKGKTEVGTFPEEVLPDEPWLKLKPREKLDTLEIRSGLGVVTFKIEVADYVDSVNVQALGKREKIPQLLLAFRRRRGEKYPAFESGYSNTLTMDIWFEKDENIQTN